jgi:hypothetical protein
VNEATVDVNWEAIGAIGELVGAAGVILSLVYLAFQIRQNTRQAQGSMYDSIVSSLATFDRPIASDSLLARIFEEAIDDWAGVDGVGRARVMHLLSTLFKQFENVHYQHRQGTLEPELWLGWRQLMLSYYRRPGVQAWWSMRRGFYSASFREFLEHERPEEELLSPRELARTHVMGGRVG